MTARFFGEAFFEGFEGLVQKKPSTVEPKAFPIDRVP